MLLPYNKEKMKKCCLFWNRSGAWCLKHFGVIFSSLHALLIIIIQSFITLRVSEAEKGDVSILLEYSWNNYFDCTLTCSWTAELDNYQIFAINSSQSEVRHHINKASNKTQPRIKSQCGHRLLVSCGDKHFAGAADPKKPTLSFFLRRTIEESTQL